MTLSQQTALIFETVEQGLFRVEDILRWADSTIVSMDRPPSWLIELSTLNPLHVQDFAKILREHTDESVPVHQRIQIVVLAWNDGRLSLKACLPKLFEILILEAKGYEESTLDRRLSEALVHWDSLELNVVELKLASEFEMIFREYLKVTQEVFSVLNWPLQK